MPMIPRTVNPPSDTLTGNEGRMEESEGIVFPRTPTQVEEGRHFGSAHDESRDFDDGANALWSLYGKEPKSYDEAWVQKLKGDMDGVLIYAGLLSGVITAFVVPKIQDLQVNPAQQSAYYQEQAVQMLAQISQQIASIGTQTSQSVNPVPPASFPAFSPSASDIRVNIFCVMSLICSLSTTLLAVLVQQWVRAYMRVHQPSNNPPLKTARIRQFLFEGVERLPVLAEVTSGLIQLSLLLFFLGLADTIVNVNVTVGVTSIVPIVLCGFLYLYSTVAPVVNPQSPYWNPLSSLIWTLIRKLRYALYHHRVFSLSTVVWATSMESHQEQLAMEHAEKRRGRDVRAVRWLVENVNGSHEMENFVLAIPGSFNQEWGREVWKAVTREAQSTLANVQVPDEVQHSAQSMALQLRPRPGLPHPRRENTVNYLCRCVQNMLEAFRDLGDPIGEEARRRRMHGCIETAAFLVCCTDVQLGWFGEIGGMLSELHYNEHTGEPLTISSNPSFVVHWTCLSLVAIKEMVADSDRLRELAMFAVSGIARFQADYGSIDEAASKGAERIDGYLKTTWEHIEDLHRAFEPWSPKRTEEEIKGILSGSEAAISKLEHINLEADDLKDVDWRISLLQDAMDEATHNLTLRIPSVLSDEPKRGGPSPISDVFDALHAATTPVTLRLIPLGRQVQGLSAVGRGLRDILEGRNPEKHQEILETLNSIDIIPIPLRRFNYARRQLWRVQDLRDGQGLGFIIELFFLALRPLSSASLSPELNRVFFTGAFEVVTSQWMKTKGSSGTKRILLDMICDLVIRDRGIFSNFSYPSYIVDMLLELVRRMVDGDRDLRPHIDNLVRELRSVSYWDCMDIGLRDKALRAIMPF